MQFFRTYFGGNLAYAAASQCVEWDLVRATRASKKRSGKAKALPGQNADGGALVRWYRERVPLLQFLARFAALSGALLLFTINPRDPGLEGGVYGSVLHWTAAGAGWVLRVCGEDAHVQGAVLTSAHGGVAVRRGCDAFEPLLLLGSAILAFPARWRSRMIALAGGFALLNIVNLLRVISLYLLKTRWPSNFDVTHAQVWPAVMVVITLIYWAQWARRQDVTPGPAVLTPTQ